MRVWHQRFLRCQSELRRGPIGCMKWTGESRQWSAGQNFLHDAVTGSNGNAALFGVPGYNAGPGYDNCSGSGSIRGAEFAFEFLTARSGGTPPGPINNLKAKLLTTGEVKLTWDAAVGATGYSGPPFV